MFEAVIIAGNGMVLYGGGKHEAHLGPLVDRVDHMS